MMRYNLKKKTDFTSILVIVSVFIIMFQSNIAELFPTIDYYDEIIALVLFFLWMLKKHFCITIRDFRILLCFIGIVIIGCMGNICSHINAQLSIMMIDAFGILKIFLTVLSIENIFSEKKCINTVLLLGRFLQIYVFVAALFYVLGMVFHLDWMFKQVRFGLGTYGFVHGYAGDGWLGYYLEACYVVFEICGNKLKYCRFTKTICLILTILTFKGPALLFVAFIVFFNLFIRRKQFKWYHVVATIGVGAFAGSWYIVRYLLTKGEARVYLNVTGLKIAGDYFPIGLGFGTFGSSMSKKFYSAAYYMYGLDSVYGLGPQETPNYITDNYWGMAFGQLGVIGTVLIAYLLYDIFRKIIKKRNVPQTTKYAVLAMFFSFMAGSLGSAYLTSHLGVSCFMILALYLCL